MDSTHSTENAVFWTPSPKNLYRKWTPNCDPPKPQHAAMKEPEIGGPFGDMAKELNSRLEEPPAEFRQIGIGDS
jgi:hypothetical protein